MPERGGDIPPQGHLNHTTSTVYDGDELFKMNI